MTTRMGEFRVELLREDARPAWYTESRTNV